jgi:FkbM family methyltransferase
MVIDLGGYQGQWASDIHARYRCPVHVFEPVPVFADVIENRFSANGLVKVHRLAAGSHDGFLDISVAADASSLHVGGGEPLRVEICDFCAWCKKNGVEEISLLKINIEGGEYQLLEHLIATDFIAKVRFVQVQFHDFVPDAEARMERIKSQLALTHGLDYFYRFVWEGWTRKHDGG